jgi:hypothetical protein
MRQLAVNWRGTAFPGQIPSEKALRMPNVRKSYDFQSKPARKSADHTKSGNLRTYHHPCSQ